MDSWNDLIIAQHPCGDAPLVGAQLRYLIGSDQGWLGALGFGPAAFALAARDQWIGWSTPARLGHLREVVGLARLLIRNEVHCTNLVSKVLSLALARLAGGLAGALWGATAIGRDLCGPLAVHAAAVLAPPTGCGWASARDVAGWDRKRW